MSGELVQDLAVGMIAAGALGWLVARRVRAAKRGSTACENCPSSAPVPGTRPAPQPEVLISIGEGSRPDPPRR